MKKDSTPPTGFLLTGREMNALTATAFEVASANGGPVNIVG